MYFLVRFFILRRSNSLTLGFRFLPFFYALTLGTRRAHTLNSSPVPKRESSA
jgi:hypothetical protein